MVTNGDPEGRIFLSHLHMNNGLFFLLTIKYVLKRVSFGRKDCTKELKPECAYFLYRILCQKFWNTLRCEVTRWCYFHITMTSLDDYVARVPIQPMYSPQATALVRYDFLSQDKIADILIRCARICRLAG